MNRNIKNIILDLKQIELLDIHLKTLLQKRTVYEKRLNQLAKELEIQNNQIQKLAKINIKSLYLKMIKKLELQLELYQKHYLQTALEYNDLIKSLELIDFEIRITKEKKEIESSKKLEFRRKLKKYKAKALNENLLEYREVIGKIEYNLKLSKELEEAIKEGSSVNRKFNSTLNLVKDAANKIYSKKKKNVEELNSFKVSEIEKYQNHIVSINHSFLKYTSEINDVYNVILESDQAPPKMMNNFMNHYRINLSNDLRKAKDLKNSYKFLKRYKDLILNLNRTLRSDLKQVKAKISELEEMESKLMSKILKKT